MNESRLIRKIQKFQKSSKKFALGVRKTEHFKALGMAMQGLMDTLRKIENEFSKKDVDANLAWEANLLLEMATEVDIEVFGMSWTEDEFRYTPERLAKLLLRLQEFAEILKKSGVERATIAALEGSIVVYERAAEYYMNPGLIERTISSVREGINDAGFAVGRSLGLVD